MSRKKIVLLLCILLVGVFWYLWPPLPMAWPDESLFFTSGRDLIEKKVWHVPVFDYLDPAYERANFSFMPLYPVGLYLWIKIFQPQNAHSVLVFHCLWALLGMTILSHWFRQLQAREIIRLTALSLFVFSPFFYYNAHALRPESALSIVTIVLLFALWKWDKETQAWKKKLWLTAISGILAWAGYLHFSGVFLLPLVLVFLVGRGQWRKSIRRILFVALFTVFLLSPWVWYLLKHFLDFQIMFGDQVTKEVGGHQLLERVLGFIRPWAYPVTLGLKGEIKGVFFLVQWFYLLMMVILFFWNWQRKTLSPFVKKLVVGLLLVAILCGFFQEAWYRMFVQTLILVCIALLLFDLERCILRSQRVALFAWLGILLCAGISLPQVLAYPHRFYSVNEFQQAVECLLQQVPAPVTVVVAAQPDPSLSLMLRKPDISIIRMNDYPKYQMEWEKVVNREIYFITADYSVDSFNGKTHIHFDHGRVLEERLRRAQEANRMTEIVCKAGSIPIYFYQLK